MSLKPTPVQAALVEEIVEGALSTNGYDTFERECLREFKENLSRHREA